MLKLCVLDLFTVEVSLLYQTRFVHWFYFANAVFFAQKTHTISFKALLKASTSLLFRV